MNKLPLILSVFALSACQTPKPVAKTQMLPPGTELLENIPMESNARVMRTAEVKAYPVARYVDPQNKDVLHEKHVIYRRERPETWRLYANYEEPVTIGPLGLRNPVAKRNPTSQELTAELNKQRLISEQLMLVMERANSGDARAQELMVMARSMEFNNKELVRKMDEYNKSLVQLRTEVDTMKQSKPVEVEVVQPTHTPAAPLITPTPPNPTLGDPKESSTPPKKTGWGLPFLQR